VSVLIALARRVLVYGVMISKQLRCVKPITNLLQKVPSSPLRWCILLGMSNSLISKYLSEIGRRGGKARMKTMTAEERQAIATKASQAAARERTKRAAERRKKTK